MDTQRLNSFVELRYSWYQWLASLFDEFVDSNACGGIIVFELDTVSDVNPGGDAEHTARSQASSCLSGVNSTTATQS